MNQGFPAVERLGCQTGKILFASVTTRRSADPQRHQHTSQLADPSTPRQQFVGIDPMEMAAMEAELADVCGEYQTAAALSGVWNLELVAARGYLDRIMRNVRVMKYLA
ncbi:plasmid partitioning protein RepB C-terminal domain-containing protein [Mesorhizobium sp. BR1-1-9]|uniref:plasmid partitioning protein RepB C-terminal domain-containing protein n=1 Tax=Mesorhizobium sp. BR1-1-9 TaxID=2876646 RepID=UPI00398D11B4